MQKVARGNIAADKDNAIIGEWGNQPVDQFLGMITEPLKWEELQDQFSRRYDLLDWDDAIHNGRAYQIWRERNKDETLNLIEDLDRDLSEGREFVDQLEFALNFLTLSPKDRRIAERAIVGAYIELANIVDGAREKMLEDERFMNPRELLYSDYFQQIRQPYYEQRNALYEQINATDSKRERDQLYDQLTFLTTQDWANGSIAIETVAGTVVVPTETRRAWSARTPEEQTQKKLDWIGGKPEWLDLQATELLVQDHPAASNYLPTTFNQFEIYRTATTLKDEAWARFRRGEITSGQRNKLLTAIDERLDRGLIETGREGEAVYRRAWPIQRLALLGKLPLELQELLEVVNGARDILRANEKGPASDFGQQVQLAVVTWAEQVFFQQNEAAADAIDDLGLDMFDEALRAAVYPKLLFGDFRGTIEPLEG
jgi:hypothetical protein